MMDDEFEHLMQLLSEKSRLKGQKLEEIFKLTSAFFDQYKEVELVGSEKEKKKFQEKMQRLKEKLKEGKVRESHIEARELFDRAIRDKRAFTKEEEEILRKTEERLKKTELAKLEILAEKKKERREHLQALKKSPKHSKKSKWMKS